MDASARVCQLLTLTLRLSLQIEDLSEVWGGRRLLGTVGNPEDSNATAPLLKKNQKQTTTHI